MKNIISCEQCGTEQLAVFDSRKINGIIYRRRKCLSCGNRITTYEIHSDDLKKIDGAGKFENMKLEGIEEWELQGFIKIMRILNSMLTDIARRTN